jgi:D-sedoheptulose 7-phosphate isomerase
MTVKSLEEHIDICKSIDTGLITDISEKMFIALSNGNKILVCGNGGSAADSQHFAAELVGRYKKERRGLPSIDLTTDSSAVTAISNDYGFEHVFSRQIEALGKKGDVLLLISTSGNSPNLVKAAKKAKEMEIETFALLGSEGGELKNLCDYPIIVPSDNTPRIQEMHIVIIHMLCELIENKLFG